MNLFVSQSETQQISVYELREEGEVKRNWSPDEKPGKVEVCARG
jgi:hypothetical protein